MFSFDGCGCRYKSCTDLDLTIKKLRDQFVYHYFTKLKMNLKRISRFYVFLVNGDIPIPIWVLQIKKFQISNVSDNKKKDKTRKRFGSRSTFGNSCWSKKLKKKKHYRAQRYPIAKWLKHRSSILCNIMKGKFVIKARSRGSTLAAAYIARARKN